MSADLSPSATDTSWPFPPTGHDLSDFPGLLLELRGLRHVADLGVAVHRAANAPVIAKPVRDAVDKLPRLHICHTAPISVETAAPGLSPVILAGIRPWQRAQLEQAISNQSAQRLP
jgi:hypothetical protein